MILRFGISNVCRASSFLASLSTLFHIVCKKKILRCDILAAFSVLLRESVSYYQYRDPS